MGVFLLYWMYGWSSAVGGAVVFLLLYVAIAVRLQGRVYGVESAGEGVRLRRWWRGDRLLRWGEITGYTEDPAGICLWQGTSTALLPDPAGRSVLLARLSAYTEQGGPGDETMALLEDEPLRESPGD